MKNNKILEFTCQYCDSIFTRTEKNAKNSTKYGSDNKYCCLQCERKSHKTGKIEKCLTCDDEVYISLSRSKISNTYFCSISCANIYKHKHGKFGIHSGSNFEKIDWIKCQELHNNGMNLTLLKQYGATQKYINKAIKLGLFIKNKLVFKHTDENKKKMSNIRNEYLKNNPDKHVWKKSTKFKSVPCENVKKYLNDNNIIFIEEYRPLTDRFFSIDIAFPEKLLGIEINGNQHYDHDGKLKKYYQDRHDLIINKGWTLLEYQSKLCFNINFLNDLKEIIINGKNQNMFDYEIYQKSKVKKIKYKTHKEYADKRKEKTNIERQKYIDLVKNSNIDFTKFGWVDKISKIINQKTGKVKQWMLRSMPEFYNENCFKRGNKLKIEQNKIDGIKEKYYNNQLEYVEIIKNSDIDFYKYGWITKTAKLLNTNRTNVYIWMAKYMPDVLEQIDINKKYQDKIQFYKNNPKYLKRLI